MWGRLDHQNIVPLLGITSTPLQLISEWMPNGNLTEYIGAHPDTNRIGLVGILHPVLDYPLTPHKLRGITDGLHYLHSRDVIHGDLKGVRDRSRSRFTIVLTAASRTSSWTPSVAHGSRISGLRQSPETCIQCEQPRVIKVIPHDGLRRRS